MFFSRWTFNIIIANIKTFYGFSKFNLKHSIKWIVWAKWCETGDDVTLLGPTLTSMKLMLNVVKLFGDRFNATFDATKTKLTKFGNTNEWSYCV